MLRLSYLKTSGFFDRLIEDAPFHYTSPNAPVPVQTEFDFVEDKVGRC